MTTRRAGNLPADLSSFVGRRNETDDLRELFSNARLVTVAGPGGVGKSRLAVRVGARLERSFHDGVWLVELASASLPALLPEVVASALRVPDVSGRDPSDALRQHLANRQLLIVLDNCEHLRDACAEFLATLLPAAPGLRVLATSQDVLGLPGEAVYRLGPLAVPDQGAGVEQVELSPAVALFADRAANAMHGFTVAEGNVDAIVELCRRLGGLPLAIELAAAQSRSLSPLQILEHIDDRFHLLASRSNAVPARHRSLWATVEWSYDLCSKPERLVWNRLSVFPSSFDLSAAEAVCTGDGLSRPEVADAVRDLVDRSVLTSEPHPWGMRYSLFESIREFGLQKLQESLDEETAVPEDVLKSRHLTWYVDLAAAFDQDWFGPRQHDWLGRLDAELPNIRAALSFASERPGSIEEGLRLAGDLCFYWRVNALREGLNWLTRLTAGASDPSAGRARALIALSWIEVARGGSWAMAAASEALSTAERLDPERVPRALLISAIVTTEEDLARARTLFERAFHAAEQTGSDADRAYAYYALGWRLGLAGAAAESDHHLQKSLAVSEAADEFWWRGTVQVRRALFALQSDDRPLMEAAAIEALRASRRVPDPLTTANALGFLGILAVGHDDPLAARLIGTAERFWDDAGGSVFTPAPWQGFFREARDRCRSSLGAKVFDDNHQRGAADSLEAAAVAALHEQPQPALAHPPEHDLGLTRRERQVVPLVSEGLTNKEIADRLVISPRTAETHVQNILTKAGFATRSQLAAWYIRVQSEDHAQH